MQRSIYMNKTIIWYSEPSAKLLECPAKSLELSAITLERLAKPLECLCYVLELSAIVLEGKHRIRKSLSTPLSYILFIYS